MSDATATIYFLPIVFSGEKLETIFSTCVDHCTKFTLLLAMPRGHLRVDCCTKYGRK